MTRERRPRTSEDGIALPVAVIVLSIVLILSAIALTSATRSSQRTQRDLEAKFALQAANAGLDLARDRLNPSKIDGVLSLAAPCVSVTRDLVTTVKNVVPAVVDSLLPGWCPRQEDTYLNGAKSSYRISTSGLVGGLLGGLLGISGTRTVVSTGTYGGTTRRVATTIGSGSSIQSYFGGYGISSNRDVSLSNGSLIETGVRSNGQITVRTNICGPAITSGPDSPAGSVPDLAWSQFCGQPAATGVASGKISRTSSRFTLPPVDTGGVSAASNDNIRLCGGLLTSGTAPGKCSGVLQPTVSFDDYRNYPIPSGDYYFCKWSMTGGGGSITIQRGSKVRVFIGSPENCGGKNDGGNVFTKGNGYNVYNENNDPATFQVYVVGSPNYTTDGVLLGQRGQTDDYMTVYAPNSNVVLNNNQGLYGAVAGDRVTGTGGGFVRTTESISTIGATGASTYITTNFRECSRTSSSAPDAGCDVD